ncbi:hypothetical protein JX265_003261 [Neoarthrinium moseri]|uniref:YCII-related domain-containing protein n=1 Tax=Neoarthrinium moseri TaxID=1658444 RepID=A0A9P9WU27_9PEZI|nr:uncharacterized protein JN550_005499 [Neoarthrinium moseri]KAI1852775.1 hypothetical protein JX266_002316 [Neoarthrinium moseri]KAI1869909.1 hypothetical protein JN550_005499 [Neoarthrinium moseri]KAI1879084.1 hypothetical protein JX265_003261 [Neoarthrinium moseri]
MSTTDTSPLRDYLVHVPDHPNTLSIRLATNKEHNEDAIPLVKAGRVPFFGSTLSRHGVEGEQPIENGTIMVFKARSEEEIKAIIKKDVFTKAGVWNADRAMIWPFLSK